MHSSVLTPLDHAIGRVEEFVRDSSLRVGDRLPSVRELGRRWDLSLLTLNRAVACLVAKGSLRREGYRLFVSSPQTTPLAVPDLAPCHAVVTPEHTELAAGMTDAATPDLRCIQVFAERDRQRLELEHILAEPEKTRGIVLWPSPDVDFHDLLEKAQALEIPIVTCDLEQGDAYDFVGTDNEHGMGLVVDHLVGLGHRNLCYITSDREVSTERHRLIGYQMACMRNGLMRSIRRVIRANVEAELGGAFDQLIRDYPQVTGVVFSHVWMTLRFEKVCRARGVEVPADLSLTGFDLVPHMPERYTTLVQDTRQIGAAAMTRLRQLVALKSRGRTAPVSRVRVEPRFLPGTSTGVPREGRGILKET